MAKRWQKAAGAAVVVAVAGLGGTWYVATGNLVSHTQQWMDELNKKLEAGGVHAKLSAERLERTGFPGVGVRLINPSFSGTLAKDGAPTLEFNFKTQGYSELIGDYLAHTYRLRNSGNAQIDVKLGEEKIAATADTASSHAELKAKNLGAFMRWNRLDWNDAEAVKAAAKDIAELRAETSAFVLKDSISGKTILSQDVSNIALTNRSHDNQLDFDASAEIKGSEITEEYAAIATRLLKAAGNTASMDLASMPFSATRAGKQDIKLDLTMNAPDSSHVGPMSNALFDLREFSVHNNFYDARLPMLVRLSETGGRRKAEVKLNWSLAVAPASTAEMERLVDLSSGSLPGLSIPAPESSEKPPELKQKIMAALPALSTLGPITLTLDLEGSVPVPEDEGSTANEEAPGEALTLRNFALTHQRWGIEAKGNAARDLKVGIKANLALDCKKCDSLTGDLYTTATQVQEVKNLLQPGQPQWGINETMHANLNQLLAETGQKDAASGDIRFTLTTPTPNDLRINDKPAGEFFMKAAMLLSPPAAGEEEKDAAPKTADPSPKKAKH